MSDLPDLSLCRAESPVVPADRCWRRDGVCVPFERVKGTPFYPYIVGGNTYAKDGRVLSDDQPRPLDIIRVERCDANGVWSQLTPAVESVPESDSEHDWPEDFQHENGNYTGCCGQCGVQFRGHKRRFYCKRCSAERQTVSASEAEPAPEPTLLEAAERVVWGIYRNGKLADVALTRSAMEYETEYAIGYRSNTAQAMLLCKASPEQIAAVERAKGGG